MISKHVGAPMAANLLISRLDAVGRQTKAWEDTSVSLATDAEDCIVDSAAFSASWKFLRGDDLEAPRLRFRPRRKSSEGSRGTSNTQTSLVKQLGCGDLASVLGN